MRKDIFELAEYARECDIETMMSTNGWFVTPQIAKRLEEVGFTHIRVSLDGATPETHDAIRGVKGSFERAVRALRFLRATKIPRIGTSPTILTENVEEIPRLIELAVQLELDEVQLVQLCQTGRGARLPRLEIEQLMRLREVFQEYRKQLRGTLVLSATEGISLEGLAPCDEVSSLPEFYGCPGGRTCLSIEAEGTIQPCILYKASAGNVRENGLAKIWHQSSLFKKMRTPLEVCKACAYVRTCSRECPIESCISNTFRKHFAECLLKEQKGG